MRGNNCNNIAKQPFDKEPAAATKKEKVSAAKVQNEPQQRDQETEVTIQNI